MHYWNRSGAPLSSSTFSLASLREVGDAVACCFSRTKLRVLALSTHGSHAPRGMPPPAYRDRPLRSCPDQFGSELRKLDLPELGTVVLSCFGGGMMASRSLKVHSAGCSLRNSSVL